MRPLATNPAPSAKALLASLMATERLTVEHDPKATTASFNVDTRVLTLPVWKDLPVDTLDMLIGHEVSHALYSPEGRETLERAVKSIDPKNYGVAKDYINVVEDVRIERLIKRDYPGLRRCFLNGYDDLLKRDLFGLNKLDRKVADLPLIDRINLQYKIGHRVTVPFTAEELSLVQRVAVTTSWDEVVALSKELYDLAREQKRREQEEEKKKSQQGGSTGGEPESDEESDSEQDGEGGGDTEDGETENQDTGDEGGQSGDEETDEDGDEGQAPDGEEGQGDVTGDARGDKPSDENAEKSDQSAAGNESGGENGDPSEDLVPDASETLKSAEENLAKNVDTAAQSYFYADIPAVTDRMVVSQKSVLDAFRKFYANLDLNYANGTHAKATRACYEAWKKSNGDAVQILATEFDRRKAADEHRRTSVGETGVIDVNRLHAYRITDDIFLRNAVVKDGKNHGLVLLLDMSGSIQNVYFDLVTQLVTLAHFCRRVNIPFRFYGFTDRAATSGYSPDGVCQSAYASDFNHFAKTNFGGEKIRTRLVTLLSDGMKNLDFIEQCGYLLWASYGMTRASLYGSDACPTRAALKALSITPASSTCPLWFQLDQTPLNAALLAAATLVPQFKREKRLQVANLIVLTDGEAGDSMVSMQWVSDQWRKTHPTGGEVPSRIVWRDPLTRKQYDMSRKSYYGNNRYQNNTDSRTSTSTLIQVLKDRGVSTTCIHVTPTRAYAKKLVSSVLNTQGAENTELAREVIEKTLKETDWFHVLSVDGKGYADYIVFPVPSITTEVELTAVNANDKAGLRSLRSQFMKSMSARRANRPLLVRVAEIVSK